MLKVFLVEDEFVIREGIKNNIDWASHGYEFCGEAGDGEVAYPMIQKCKPDIVITDIRMPFMDGLELSKLIKKEMPWIEIIILTGFEEFAYAKEAIKLGVAQYLSKPISGDELLQELGQLAEKIREKKREQEVREQYQREMEENVQKNRKDFFKYLVTGSKTPVELLEMADHLELDISAIWYNIVLVQIQSTRHARDEFSSSIVEAEETLKSYESESDVLSFERSLEGKALLFKGDSREEIEEKEKLFLEVLQKTIGTYHHLVYYVGMGEPVNRLRELPESFEQARRAFAHRYLQRDNMVVRSQDREKTEAEEVFAIESVNTKEVNRGKITEFLKMGGSDEVVYFVEEFFRGAGTNALKSGVFRQYIVMDAYFCVSDFLESIHVGKEQVSAPDLNSGIVGDEKESMDYVQGILQKAVNLREQRATDRYRDVVEQVKYYIDENYAEEDLSLNTVASYVNFSPNHLSTIFSQQTGQTFIKYLTDYRMGKAKELLRCTGEKSSAISLLVGYKDAHYFSYLFKKTQGMTPTQYRNGANAV